MKKVIADGSILPVVLVISIAMIAVGLSLVETTSSIRVSLSRLYVSQIGAEAAQSGAVYANYCYNKYGGQSWDSKHSHALTQSTDCFGTPNGSYPPTLLQDKNFTSTFSVGDIEAPNKATHVVGITSTVSTFALGTTVKTDADYGYTTKVVLDSTALKASQSASGKHKTCAIVSGTVYCWGANSYNPNDGGLYAGNLGDGGAEARSLTPVPVYAGSGSPLHNQVPSKIVSAQYHSCVLTLKGNISCWGDADYGQLGIGDASGARNTPQAVNGVINNSFVTDIAAAGNTTCAIGDSGATTGQIYCWGDNSRGTVGNGSNTSIVSLPQAVSTLNGLPDGYKATMLASSGSESYDMCAVANNIPYCWGDDANGQIGNGTISNLPVSSPAPVYTDGTLQNKTITAITQNGTQGSVHVCVVADRSVYCWGTNQQGELGTGTYGGNSSVPVKVHSNGTFTNSNVDSVYAGIHHTCALENNRIYCWGVNDLGELGNKGIGTRSNLPVSVYMDGALAGLTVTAISGGGNRGCAIAGYSTYCWGLNSDGQIGDGTTTNRFEPTKASFLDPHVKGFLF